MTEADVKRNTLHLMLIIEPNCSHKRKKQNIATRIVYKCSCILETQKAIVRGTKQEHVLEGRRLFFSTIAGRKEKSRYIDLRHSAAINISTLFSSSLFLLYCPLSPRSTFLTLRPLFVVVVSLFLSLARCLLSLSLCLSSYPPLFA